MPGALHAQRPQLPGCGGPARLARRRLLRACLSLPALGLLAAAAPAIGQAAFAAGGLAPLFDGLDGHPHEIESQDPRVRRYFDQGMLLVYGFNPAEARRSFESALSLAPQLASGWWALAWALGPNINTDMAPADAPIVHHALQQARQHGHRAPPVMQALIAALSLRHPAPDALEEEAYAERMAELARQHPQHADVALLAAEAQLNLHPYDWWDAQGQPLPWTPGIEALLQQALRLSPRHPGAHHYWIHLQEQSARPQRGQASADLLRDAYPGSGHLLHMPSHIDMRVGRYADAVQANQRSIEADLRYLAQVDVQGAYRVGYVAHNHHFLWAAAGMAGRQHLALEAAAAAWPAACGPAGRDPGLAITAHYAALPFFARVRFGLWDEMLRHTPPPDVPGPYALALWHHGRASAHARLGDARQAAQELQRLRALTAVAGHLPARVKNINPAPLLLRIAERTAQADLALARRQPAQAVRLLREATRIEDSLQYDEPHLWLAPVRHALGHALLQAGQAAAAASVYRQDLAHYPANGWSLTGLAMAQARLGQADAAAATRTLAAAAFADAERRPASSRF